MSSRLGVVSGLVLAVVAAAAPALAQGTQTGVLSGTVTSNDGLALPGATVMVQSPSLIGTRSAITDANGAYIFKGLPPGEYKVTIEMSGMQTVQKKETLAPGTARMSDVRMNMAGMEESLVVTAELPTALSTATGGVVQQSETMDLLANGRTLVGISETTPGLTDNTPNTGQLAISGAFAYDNVFLIDGVDVNDNLFGQPHNLFIEDAIDEVAVLTSGISAEFGRFSGGVVNAITKRGGNSYSGSFRTDFTNPDWKDETPYEDSRNTVHKDILGKVFQATLGGPVLKDRLWFFAAARRERTSTPGVLRETAIGYTRRDANDRQEIKLTGNVDPNHSLQGTFIRNETSLFEVPSFAFSVDPRALEDVRTPNTLAVVNYNGLLSSNLFVEAQVSQKKYGFRDNGGDSTVITDSPMIDLGTGGALHYNAPYFDATDPEDRNNRQATASLSYFVSTPKLGKHDLKVGFEHYTSTNTGGNSQTATGYVFWTNFKRDAANAPVLDSQGRLIPVFGPDSFGYNWLAVRGAQVDIKTLSFYLNDRWVLNNRWSFNVGARFESVDGDATGGLKTVDVGAVIVPRVAVSFDPLGNGKWRLDATFGQYAGKYSESQFAANTNVGNPDQVEITYGGPAGEGLGFAPGFDIRNYRITAGEFPTANVFVDEDLRSPLTNEVTFGVGRQIWKGGYVKALYTRRSTSNLVEDFVTIDNGVTTVVREGVEFGTFDNILYRNTDEPKREYQGLQLLGQIPITNRWNVFGSYTYQIRNHGSFEGEAANQPGASSVLGDQPEFLSAERHYPYGRLAQFQRHKVFAYTTYSQSLGRFGEVSGGLTWRYDAPLTYSHFVANVAATAQQLARDPGYRNPLSTQTIYFGERGSEEFAGSHVFHFALNYSVPVWRTAKPWFKAEVRNLFNNDTLIGWDRTVAAVTGAGAPVDELGLPTTFTRRQSYGTATANTHYPDSRELRFSVGFRF